TLRCLRMRERAREGLGRAGLALAAAAVCVLVLEAGLRLSGYAPTRLQAPGELYGARERVFLDCYPSNPRGCLGSVLRRGEARRRYETLGVAGIDAVAARAPFAVEFRYNSLFFREREIPPKAAGTLRVVLLGDSFTEGQGVKEADTTARRLQAPLHQGARRWGVLHCAPRRAGFPSLHKMFDKVLAFEPDIVVHATVLNDADRSPEIAARLDRLDDWILDRRRVVAAGSLRPGSFDSRLVDFVRDRLQGARIGRETTRWY